MTTILLAMDRASVRRRDANGYLHVEISNLSKANICPYMGSEIPNWRDLGLEPDRVYRLYRDPEELARGAHTFNNIPLLSEHLPVNPDLWDDEIPNEVKIGSTGTDAVFVIPYLQNSLVVWSARYQQAIDDETQRELSCGYRYRADMTPGQTADGLHYDGVMRDIMGNHVALVIEGRAGPDVVVGDELMKLKSRTALMISGALQATVRPLLAADAKVDLSSALMACDAASLGKASGRKKAAEQVLALVAPHLAADKSIDLDGIGAVIASISPMALDEDKIEEAEDEDPEAAEDDDPDAAEDEDPDGAEDEDDDDKPKGMDAATVRKLISQAEDRGARRVAALDQARADVKPLVGEVVGMDSAQAIYAFALDTAGYDKADLKGAKVSTLRAMVAREVELAKPKQPLALDSAATKRANDSFADLYGSK
ncbi:DUF2213 domain-containing protein [Novosphingobium resinovorum]|uniref:DUF2213 domain-containing protein n=1 Tax=Novosphingobium resinovorum TaxID=158500 RepID=A0A1D8A2H0_9SPHN|nr:DUF2213 domain-containing protein [Novosphingobium resinovorum]AOR76333.1 hypothetical protein BES08_05835 [Novosphingobium resinovorum]